MTSYKVDKEAVNHIIIKYRVALLSVIIGITLFMGYNAQKVELDYELAQMLPETDSTYIQYNEFKELFGEDARLILLAVKDSSILELDKFQAYYQLNQSIKDITVQFNGADYKGVKSVMSLCNLQGLEYNKADATIGNKPYFATAPQTQHELDSTIRVLTANQFYNNLVFSQSDSTFVTLMSVSLQNEIVNSKSRIELVKHLVEASSAFTEETGIDIHYSGLPYIRTHVMSKVRGELSMFIALAALVLAVILYIIFRSFKVVLTSILIVGISVVWVFGFIALFGFKITILTGLIPPLIIVIGIPNIIFLLNKYHQECASHGKASRALEVTISKIGGVIFLTNLTTAAGFATFLVTSSSLLVEFGVIASINIMCLFLISVTVFPIALSFQKKPSGKYTKHLENKFLNRAIKWLILHTINYRNRVYLGSAILVLFSLGGMSMIQTAGNVVDDIPHDDDVYQDLLFFEKEYKGVLPFEIIIDTKEENGVFNNGAKALYKMHRLDKLIQRDDNFSPYFTKPISLVDGLKYIYQTFKGGDAKFYALPRPSELNKLKKLKGEGVDNNASFAAFIDSTNQIARMTVMMANVNTLQISDIKDSLRVEVDKIFPPAEYNVSFTGTSLVFLEGTNFLVRNLFMSLGIAIILISVFIALMFKSLRTALISILPNVIPLLFTAGIMGYFGIQIKPSTILVFSIAFGISVDDSIHYLAKYRQELAAHRGRIKFSVIEAIKGSGVSMIYTSIVLFFGFSIFTASSFGGTIALGLLVSLTLLVAMLTNLILLPAMLMSLDKAKLKKKK